MLHPGRLGVNEAESAAIDALGEDVVGFTREADLLHVTVGEDVYEVSDDGTTVKHDG